MTLDARRRTSIYQKLVPLLGEDDANALMTQYPSNEAEQLVTKDHLRAELTITGGDLRSEMGVLGADLRGEMGSLRADLRGEMGELRLQMAELQTTLTLRLGGGLAAATGLLAAIGLLR